MKILDTTQFILERVKIKPVTNAELDKAIKYYDDSLPLRQGDVAHITYSDRYYMVIMDKDLIYKSGIMNYSNSYENGALVSIGTIGKNYNINRMPVMDYDNELNYICSRTNSFDSDFDIIDVWRPNEQIAINKKTLIEDNIKAAIKTPQYRKIYTRN